MARKKPPTFTELKASAGRARPGAHSQRRGLAFALAPVLGLSAAALVLLGNATYGPVGAWDSVTSLQHMGVIGSGHLPSHATPPGYAAVSWLVYTVFDLSPVRSAGLVSTGAFGLTVLILALWLRMAGVSSLVVIWCGVVCMLSPLAVIAAEVMTDALFVLWVTLALFWLDRASAGRAWFLALAALAAACACLTRLMGVAVIVSGAIFLLIAWQPAAKGPESRRRNALARASIAGLYAAAAIAPVAAWVLLCDIPLGEELRHRVGFNLPDSFSRAVRTLVEWTFGRDVAHLESSAWNQWTGFSSLTLSALASLGGLMAFIAIVAVPLAALDKRQRRRAPLLWAARANGLFLLCYPAVLLAMLWFRDLGTSPRYLLPMYAPGVFILALALQAHGRHIQRFSQRFLDLLPGRAGQGRRRAIGPMSAAALAGLIVFLIWQGVRLPQLVIEKREAMSNDLTLGRGLTAKRYASSNTIRHVAEHVAGASLLATNRRSALMWHLDPLRERLRVEPAADNPAAADYIVWLYPHGERYPWWVQVCREQQRFDAAINGAGWRVVAALDDGIVMRQAQAGASPSEIREASLRGFVGGARPIYESAQVAVHLGADRIIYAMNGRDAATCPCGAFPFFLHVTPVDADDLPQSRRGYGFDNLDHLFTQRPWSYLNAACGAAIPLPDYAIRHLRTGKSSLAADGRWRQDWAVEIDLAGDDM